MSGFKDYENKARAEFDKDEGWIVAHKKVVIVVAAAVLAVVVWVVAH